MATKVKEKKEVKVSNVEALNQLIERAKKAQEVFSKYSQEEVDRIFKAAATAADKARIPLAKNM